MPTTRRPEPDASGGPTRTCIGCRRPLPKHRMTRFVVVGDLVHVDESQTLPGRGCYVCDRPECLEVGLAKQGRRLRQALRSSGVHATVDGNAIRTGWLRAVDTRIRDSSQ